MATLEEENARLRLHLSLLNTENATLQKQLEAAHDELHTYHLIHGPLPPPPPTDPTPPPLTPSLYPRYGRQMLLPELGLPGQRTLSAARVLIIGLGGLGSPAALYLAAAGIGTLGLLDGDSVDLSNLHRQPLHTTSRLSLPKSLSAYHTLHARNPHITYNLHSHPLTPENARGILARYDLVLDCTDNPAARYLISDTCVALGKPLVSAAALRADGQLLVLNNPPGVGPCYRCVWPAPPGREPQGCAEAGVLGPAVGVVGTMVAVEAVKVLLGRAGGRMLVFAGWAEVVWRCVRVRGRRGGCAGCGGGAGEKERDYERRCEVAGWGRRVQVEEARRLRERGVPVLDTRDETQFGICALEGSWNVPFERWERCAEGEVPEGVREAVAGAGRVLVVCRMGNDSQAVARWVEERLGVEAVDVRGGLMEWARRAPGDGVYEY